MYKGKEPCQGCQKTGEEVNRQDKNSLCRVCKDYLRVGKTIENKAAFDNSYINVFQHWHAFRVPELGVFAHEILEALDNPNAEAIGFPENIKHEFGSNGKYYKVPSNCFEAIKKFFLTIEKKTLELKDELDNLPKKAQEAIRAEKNKIFNEGLEEGKNLLFSLNAVSITLDEFNQKINKF